MQLDNKNAPLALQPSSPSQYSRCLGCGCDGMVEPSPKTWRAADVRVVPLPFTPRTNENFTCALAAR
jgi:hypothetical protein